MAQKEVKLDRKTNRSRIKEIEASQEPQTHSRPACQRGFQEPNIKNYECAVYDLIKIYKTIWIELTENRLNQPEL